MLARASVNADRMPTSCDSVPRLARRIFTSFDPPSSLSLKDFHHDLPRLPDRRR